MHALATPMTALADEEIFTRLLEQHAGIIRKIAFGYSNTFADRQDLMQEITLQLWRAYPRYSPGRPFSTWMYRIALNVAISFLRKGTRGGETVPFDERQHDIARADSSSPETMERMAILKELIAKCEPLERALLLLYLDDCSYREIAAVLGLTETNVATKLNRLKETLRQQLPKA
jgi:RNA polymerase sigma factor (sigma-70 family)